MKKVILGLVAIAALAACSKDNGNDNSNGNGEFNNNGDPTIEQGTLPKEETIKDKNGKITSKTIYQIEGGKVVGTSDTDYENGNPKRTTNSIYTYKGALLEKIESSKESTTYTYEGNKVVERVTNNKYGFTYTYDGNNLSKTVYKFSTKTYREGTFLDAIRYEESSFIYNGNRITVNEKKYTEIVADKSKIDEEVETTIYTVENGNVTKEESVSGSYKRTVIYTYDGKKNPLSNNLSKMLNPNYFIVPKASKNNLLTVTETIEEEGNTEIRRSSYEYIYDGDYPTTVREFKEENNRKELKEITEYKY